MSLAQINPFDYFSDTNGDPLDQGYIYVGAANQDPVTNPIAIYYDAEMTIPAPQPLRTVAGYISNPIAPQTFFTNQNYSVSVRDKNQGVLFYVANFSSIVSNTPFALQLAASNAWIAAFQADTQAWGDNFIATNDAWAANYRATNEAWAAAFQANLIQRYLSFNNRGNWATGTGYAIQDLVIQGSIAYICLIAHTSGVFATDLANGDWAIYQGATKSELGASNGSSLIGFIQAGTGAVQRTMQGKGRDFVTPFDFGAVGDGVTDDTLAIQRMFASGAKVFDFLGSDYLINLTEGSTLYKFQSLRGVQIKGSGRLLDKRTYTTGAFTIIFWFDSCIDCEVDFNYTGTAIVNKSDPSAGVGYRGATFVNCSTGCYNIVVRGDLRYLRYGVCSGDYATPSLGYNTAIKTYLNTTECGYPIAHYLANSIDAHIIAQGSHRSAYLAGVMGGNITIFCKDNYIAPTLGCIISDATTNGITGVDGTSRGSSNLKISVTDMGSTTFVATSWLVSISPSRVDPNTVYENIDITVNLRGTDTVCTTVGAFALYSAVNYAIPGFYPYNWEQTVIIRNIKVSGMVDRTLQTLPNGNSSGELYVNTQDSGVHAATVDGITFEDLQILNGSGSFPHQLYCINPIMTAPINFTRCNFSNYPLVIQNSATVATNISNCTINSPTNTNPSDMTMIRFVNTNTVVGQTSSNVAYSNSLVSGAGLLTKQILVDVTLSGASVNVTPQLPAGAILIAVSATIKSKITGSTGFQLGVAATPNLFADNFLNTVGTQITPTNSSASFTSPLVVKAYTNILITSRTSNFTGGVLRVCASYMIMSAPT